MDINLLDYIKEQAFILIPVLYVLGLMLKSNKTIQDWVIPWILTICSILGAVLLMGLNINAVIQGILCVGVAVYGNQLVKQTTEKREQV
ncbi:putative phage holin [Clostridium sporogenes]|uniref:Putative phage holin n=1 Tax=Clostridium sporogenes TaxID=1509 RepID=A0A1L3NKD6_CLOSG|nr:phage holin family protein [Clostridium sporogenes]APH16501.1 putative phage holin [Clostridium sporogenes]